MVGARDEWGTKYYCFAEGSGEFGVQTLMFTALLPPLILRGRWLWEGIVFRKIIPGGLFMEVHTQASLFSFL